MKKVTFEVSPKKNFSLAEWLKGVNNIPCRMYVKLGSEGLVEIQDIEEKQIDEAVNLVSDYCDISAAEIDNISDAYEENVKAVSRENEVGKSAFSVPQKDEDFVPKNIEFKNKYIEEKVNKLLKMAYSAMVNGQATEEEIGHYFTTAMSNIYFNYFAYDKADIKVGDVVDCNYGYSVDWETNGGHVAGIVCDIIDNTLVYVVPITKSAGSEIVMCRSYIEICMDRDVIYDKLNYNGGTALVDKGSYIRIERINEVIGKTTSVFMEKLLYKLSTTFDFTSSQDKKDYDATSYENYIEDEPRKIVFLEAPEVVKKVDKKSSNYESEEFLDEEFDSVEDDEEEFFDEEFDSNDDGEEEFFDKEFDSNEDEEEEFPDEEFNSIEEVEEELHEEVAEPIEEVEEELHEEVAEPIEEVEKELHEEVAEQIDEVEEPIEKVDELPFKDGKAKSKKPGIEEKALTKYIGCYLDQIDKSKPLKETIETFISDIGMIFSELIEQAFWAGCNVKKINYAQIVQTLNSLHPEKKAEDIKEELQETFKLWLEDYPNLSKECPKISFTSLLKVFARQFE